mgnify:CR=1 FL=1
MKFKKSFIWIAVATAFAAIIVGVAANFADEPKIIARANIKISDDIKSLATHHSTLFVTVFEGDNPMPYGAMREPITVNSEGGLRQIVLTEEKLMVMDSSRPRPERMRIKVRLDADGSAGPDQPGDITGQISGIEWGSKETLEVTLDTFIKE